MLEVIAKINTELDTTAIVITHNAAIARMADRVIYLADGSIQKVEINTHKVSPAELSLLLGEMAICIAMALPLGMALGYGLVHMVSTLVSSDQFLFPVIIQPATYAWSGLTVLISGLASALVVRRRIDKLEMVAALKTRE